MATFTLTETEKEICCNIFRKNEEIGELANSLKSSFMERGIFTKATTYEQLANDDNFKQILADTFRLNLPTSIESSKYGRFDLEGQVYAIVDDWTLYQLKPKNINDLCKFHTVAVATVITNNRKKMLDKITNLVRTVLIAFDFEGTPVKKAKPIQTKKQLKEDVEKRMDSISVI